MVLWHMLWRRLSIPIHMPEIATTLPTSPTPCYAAKASVTHHVSHTLHGHNTVLQADSTPESVTTAPNISIHRGTRGVRLRSEKDFSRQRSPGLSVERQGPRAGQASCAATTYPNDGKTPIFPIFPNSNCRS